MQNHVRAIAQAISRQLLTAEAGVHARLNPCGVCGGQRGSGTGFPLSPSVFRCQYLLPLLHIKSCYHVGMVKGSVRGPVGPADTCLTPIATITQILACLKVGQSPMDVFQEASSPPKFCYPGTSP
jgi:hypothetical protein